MPLVRITLVGAPKHIPKRLAEVLTGPAEPDVVDGVVTVRLQGIAQCETVGSLLAGVIRDSDADLELHLDGPGADTVLYKPRLLDGAMLASSLATCAGFQ